MLLHEFTGKSICKPVSFEIKQGDRIVLDGKNGAGKSSLLKMLVGEHIEHSGVVSIGSGIVVSYVQQDKKVLLAKSLCEQAHLYVWDEPMNYIDIYSRMQIKKLIKEFMPTMIFVEHDSAFRNNIATKSIQLITE